MAEATPSGDAPFVVTPDVFRLVWEDGEYAGLVVRALGLEFGQVLELAPMVDAIGRMRPEDLTPDRVADVLGPFRVIGGLLVSWNLHERIGDELRPVPATYDGLIRQKPPLIQAILKAWVQASGGVPDPLASPSPGGLPGPSPEDLAAIQESLRMTTLDAQAVPR